MELGSPDLLDVLLEPPEDIFSTGSLLELGFNCSPPEVPVTRLQEQALQGWDSSGGHGCGLQESESEDFLKLFIDPNEVYCSEASPGSDSGNSEDPGLSDSPPAVQAPSSPALYEVVYEAEALQRMQGEARPTLGLISIQLGQFLCGKRPSPSHEIKGISPTNATAQPLVPQGEPLFCPSFLCLLQISGAHNSWCQMPAWSVNCPLIIMHTSCPEALQPQCLLPHL
uniref:Cyclic AMP-responsive element-binding protein 3-like protein 4 n=1 Tax=Urocitellus parryii TaxID=9999 RepID=A0A8D2HVE9_UROPR